MATESSDKERRYIDYATSLMAKAGGKTVLFGITDGAPESPPVIIGNYFAGAARIKKMHILLAN